MLVSLLALSAYWHGLERYFKVKDMLSMPEPPASFGRRTLQPFAITMGFFWLAIMLSYLVKGSTIITSP
jgi:hypothetical protein